MASSKMWFVMILVASLRSSSFSDEKPGMVLKVNEGQFHLQHFKRELRMLRVTAGIRIFKIT